MTTANLVQNKNNNIDLVLVPEKTTTPFTEASIYELIEASEFRHLQSNASNIKNAIAELNTELKALSQGLKVRQVTYEILERKDATISFNIEDEDMSAVAEITTAIGGKHLSAKAILNAAQDNGVRKGFSKEGLIKLAQSGAKAEPGSIVKGTIAEGKQPINGKDTRIKPLVESAQSRILKPKEREDGSVDMRDLGDIICVKVGDPLAQRIPFTQGTPGYTVLGNVLAPTPGEDLQLVAGEGTTVSPKNQDILISELVGLPRVIDNGMSVDQVYQINNVDVGTGHIKFEGSVIISGDVKEGMKVVASGDINIEGFVESAYLEAGGDITIKKGVIGRKQEVEDGANINDIEMSAVLECKGNLFATYSQYAEITCLGNMRIENQLTHNIATVGGNLWVGREDKADGKLIGGYIRAGESVQAGTVGATAGSKTIISFENKINEFVERLDEIEERLTFETGKTSELQALAKKLKSLPKEHAKPEMLEKVITTFKYHGKRMGEVLREKELAEQELQEYMTHVYVESTEKLYQSVELRVGNFIDRTKREYGPSKMHYNERKIHIDAVVVAS